MSRTRARDWILLALISIVTFLVLGELAIRAYLTQRTFYDVEMSRYARSLKLDAENPLIGHLHRPNREVKLMNVTVRINSDGFRGGVFPIEANHNDDLLDLDLGSRANLELPAEVHLVRIG